MCIVCQGKEVAKFQEQAIEALAKSLEEMVDLVKRYCPCAVPSEAGKLARAEGLLTDGFDPVPADPEERSQGAPRGIPEPVWAAMPDGLRAVILAAEQLGGEVQVVKLSDILEEVETKH